MKEIRCIKCGSTDILMNIGLNPNDKRTVNAMCIAHTDTDEGWCSKCGESCRVELFENDTSCLCCEKCGSINLHRMAWVKPNECDGVIGNCGSSTDWCESCQSHIKPVLKNELEKKLNDWICNIDFITMEKITGLKQYNFDAEEGYQAFIDACKTIWEGLSIEEKTSLWNQYKY